MQTNHQTDNLRIKITANDRGNPPGKLADVELHFSGESPLVGLEVDRLQRVGAAWRPRPERDIPRAQLQRQRRASQLCATPADRRRDGAEHDSRSDPRGVR